eukprot:gene6288-577_t
MVEPPYIAVPANLRKFEALVSALGAKTHDCTALKQAPSPQALLFQDAQDEKFCDMEVCPNDTPPTKVHRVIWCLQFPGCVDLILDMRDKK